MAEQSRSQVVILTLAGLLICGLQGTAQDKALNDEAGSKTVVSAHGFGNASRRRLLGKVKAEGGKIVFASKFGGPTWNVINPEALKGLEGENVQVFAQISRESKSIQVLHVRTFTAANQGTPMK